MKTEVLKATKPTTLPRGAGVNVASTASKAAPIVVAIKTILVPLDFSHASMQAVSYAVSFAKKFGATIHLVHVEAPDEACAMASAGHVMRETAESVAALHERLAGVQQKHMRAFWPENCHVRNGHPYLEICALAREIRADLIVLATRGHTGLKRVLLGSTAERVVRLTPCPVLIVRERKRKGDVPLDLVTSNEELIIRKILVPVDFSDCGMTGAMYAANLAKTFGATLRLFHAVRPIVPVVLDRVTANMAAQDKINLSSARKEMSAFSNLEFLRDAKFETVTRAGYAVDEICGAGNADDIDLLVTSTHGHTGLNHALLGSVAEQVVRYAETPVMVVPSRCATS